MEHAELEAEREHLAGLYDLLDAERARVRAEHEAALGDRGARPMDRDVGVRAAARAVRRLEVADDGLCFGRLDDRDGGRRYVGRIGLRRADDEPALLDWRAPASRPFYTATAAHPEDVARRRRFRTRGRRLVDIDDEVFDGPGGVGSDAALLAAVSAPRGEGMREIVATIQAEQDAVIRLDHPGVTVVEGGPGTGKTVVALHRVAYLLYTRRESLERHGVLVVGPTPAFLDHIERVLPSLGESDVVLTTTGGLVPGLQVTAEDPAATAEAKGSLAVLGVLAAAVADRQRVPDEPVAVPLADGTAWIDAETASWAREEARASGRPHHQEREVFAEVVTYVLAERAATRLGRGWLARDDRAARAALTADVRAELADSTAFAAALDALWPVLTPQELLADLLGSPERLRAAGADPALHRADGTAWTVSDVPLLDELVDLLGADPAAERAGARAAAGEQRAQAEYAAGVIDLLALDREERDEDMGLAAEDVIGAGALAERFVERDTRALAERAAADRDWTYRHVVVDEAQELSEMDWRVLMRRCPSRSFTVVGDLAQRRSPAGAGSWGAVLDRYVPGRWTYRALSVNYRTPAEIMDVAAALLADVAPDLPAPRSVRAGGERPWARRVGDDGEEATTGRRRRRSRSSSRRRPTVRARASSSARRGWRTPWRPRRPRGWSSTRSSSSHPSASSPRVRGAPPSSTSR